VIFAACALDWYASRSYTAKSKLVMENVEALTSSDETYFGVKTRVDTSCTIHVGAKGRIKLFNGTVLSSDANGNITLDGKVICRGRGDVMCRPIDCSELYSIIF